MDIIEQSDELKQKLVFYGLKMFGRYRSLNDHVDYLKGIYKLKKRKFAFKYLSFFLRNDFSVPSQPYSKYSLVMGVVISSVKEIKLNYHYIYKEIYRLLGRESMNKLEGEDYHSCPFLSGKYVQNDPLNDTRYERPLFYTKLLYDLDFALKRCFLLNRGKKNKYESFKERFVKTRELHFFAQRKINSDSGVVYFNQIHNNLKKENINIVEIEINPSVISYLEQNKHHFQTKFDKKTYLYLLGFLKKEYEGVSDNSKANMENYIDDWAGRLMGEFFNDYKFLPFHMKERYLKIYKKFGSERTFTSSDVRFYLDLCEGTGNVIMRNFFKAGLIEVVGMAGKIKKIYRLRYIPELFKDGKEQEGDER